MNEFKKKELSNFDQDKKKNLFKVKSEFNIKKNQKHLTQKI